MRYEVFSKNPGKLPDESEHVSSIAKKLKKYMNTDSFRSEVEKVHKVNGRSQQIQALIAPELEKLGFLSEKTNLFSNGKVPGLKPDLYLKIGRSRYSRRG